MNGKEVVVVVTLSPTLVTVTTKLRSQKIRLENLSIEPRNDRLAHTELILLHIAIAITMNSVILRRAFIRNGAFRSSVVVSTSQRNQTMLYIQDCPMDNRLCSWVAVRPVVPSASLFEHRSFSSETNVVDALVGLLDREHKEEVENDRTSMPEPLQKLHESLTVSGSWKIASDDSSSITKLYKTVDSVKVHVSFHCQDGTERLVEDEEEETQENENEDNEDQEEAASVRFTVSATKGGKTLFIVCIAQDSMMRIQNVAVAGAVQDIDALHANGLNQSLYQGPEFTELAEDLQDAFYAYIEDYLGINGDVATYISMQFDYKEQCQYVKFLDDAKSLLA
jgi:complement component 1 Q subcomponent-binding protein, mitochondrial